jgi:hypothetical protein
MTLAESILKAAAGGLYLTPKPIVGPGIHTGRKEQKAHKYRWGDDDDHTLLSMRTLGLSWDAIGKAMERSHEACRQRHLLLTMPREEHERRKAHKRLKRRKNDVAGY